MSSATVILIVVLSATFYPVFLLGLLKGKREPARKPQIWARLVVTWLIFYVLALIVGIAVLSV